MENVAGYLRIIVIVFDAFYTKMDMKINSMKKAILIACLFISSFGLT